MVFMLVGLGCRGAVAARRDRAERPFRGRHLPPRRGCWRWLASGRSLPGPGRTSLPGAPRRRIPRGPRSRRSGSNPWLAPAPIDLRSLPIFKSIEAYAYPAGARRREPCASADIGVGVARFARMPIPQPADHRHRACDRATRRAVVVRRRAGAGRSADATASMRPGPADLVHGVDRRPRSDACIVERVATARWSDPRCDCAWRNLRDRARSISVYQAGRARRPCRAQAHVQVLPVAQAMPDARRATRTPAAHQLAAHGGCATISRTAELRTPAPRRRRSLFPRPGPGGRTRVVMCAG